MREKHLSSPTSSNDMSELLRRRQDLGVEVTVALATKSEAKSFMGCDWSMARENSCIGVIRSY